MFFHLAPKLKMYDQKSQYVKYDIKYSHEYLIFITILYELQREKTICINT